MKALYVTKATATGGRDGSASTDDRKLEVKLATPRELGGTGGDGTNPEQLFACGYSACFLSSIKFVAGQSKTRIAPETTVTATIGVGPRDDGQGFGLDVELQIVLPGIEHEAAEALVAKAHIVCPYSHATRGNLNVRLSVA
jgi:osmotically inducible protein OsmC